FAPQSIDLIRGHPILGIEKQESVQTTLGLSAEERGQGAKMGLNSVNIRFQHRKVAWLQVIRYSAAFYRIVASTEGLPGEIIVFQRELTQQSLKPGLIDTQ